MTKILFIGNSYTFYNDMPQMLLTIARNNGKEITVHSVTKGGRKLYENLNEEDKYNRQIRALINDNEYDVLFLQEQSYFALVDYAEFKRGICELARLVAAKRTVLYATWGRKTGCDLLEKYGWTTDGMTDGLYDAYGKAAKEIGAELSPVGLCFKSLSHAAPHIELYNPDLSHPSYAGSFTAALCHYFKIFGELPENFDGIELDKNEIDIIKQTVLNILQST